MPHKLLLADDSVTIQRVIELTFADEAIQVVAVGDGREAIARLESDRPDIVLADVGMPERNGYEVAAFIRATPAYAHIPVLLLTGAFEPIDEARARAVGCDGVLVKPFEPQVVINRVKDLLASGRLAVAPAVELAAPTPAPTLAPEPATEVAAAPVPPARSGSIEDYFDRLDAAFASVEAGTDAQHPEPAISTPAPQPTGFLPADLATSAPLVEAPARLDLSGWEPDLAAPHAIGGLPVPRVAALPAALVEPVPDMPLPSSEPVPPIVAEVIPQVTRMPFDDSPVGSDAFPQMTPAPSPPAPMRQADHSSAGAPALADAFAALLAAERGQPTAAAALGSPEDRTEQLADDVTARVLERLSDRVVREVVVEIAERLVREEIARIKADARS